MTGSAIVTVLVCPVIGQRQKVSFGALERFHITYTWPLSYFKLKESYFEFVQYLNLFTSPAYTLYLV